MAKFKSFIPSSGNRTCRHMDPLNLAIKTILRVYYYFKEIILNSCYLKCIWNKTKATSVEVTKSKICDLKCYSRNPYMLYSYMLLWLFLYSKVLPVTFLTIFLGMFLNAKNIYEKTFKIHSNSFIIQPYTAWHSAAAIRCYRVTLVSLMEEGFTSQQFISKMTSLWRLTCR